MFVRLFIILSILSGCFLGCAYSSEPLDPLVGGYYRAAEIRYPNHVFTIDGRPVEGAEEIERWHAEHAVKVDRFSKNIFGKLEGRNWAFASLAIVYQKNEGEFSVSDIYTFPHIFGSGVRINMPEPSDDAQRAKQAEAASISRGFELFFADDERPGSVPSERLAHFIQEIEPIVMEHLRLFISPHRSEEKIRGAFSAWRGSAGDKNLCRNWFTDSEQVILSYVRRHSGRIFTEHLEYSIKGKPLFLILNIVTLNDMCGICFRSVYIQSKMGSGERPEPLVSFVTGVFPYHGSRDGLRLSDVLVDLPATLTDGDLAVRNMRGTLK